MNFIKLTQIDGSKVVIRKNDIERVFQSEHDDIRCSKLLVNSDMLGDVVVLESVDEIYEIIK